MTSTPIDWLVALVMALGHRHLDEAARSSCAASLWATAGAGAGDENSPAQPASLAMRQIAIELLARLRSRGPSDPV